VVEKGDDVSDEAIDVVGLRANGVVALSVTAMIEHDATV
jgi:hypothetical protein